MACRALPAEQGVQATAASVCSCLGLPLSASSTYTVNARYLLTLLLALIFAL